MAIVEDVKKSLGITGDWMDETLIQYINEVQAYMIAAGVEESIINSPQCTGVIARGVADLWQYGSGQANLSRYFKERVIQLR